MSPKETRLVTCPKCNPALVDFGAKTENDHRMALANVEKAKRVFAPRAGGLFNFALAGEGEAK